MNGLGKLKKNPDGYQVIFERVYNHNISAVWDALTNPEKMSKWFTDVEMDFKVGGKMTITFQDEDKTKSHGTITAIEPQNLFEFKWENDDFTYELARWELFAESTESTKLVLDYSRVIEDYASGVAAGWHIVLDDLADFLGGKTDFPAFGGGETPEGIAMKEKYTRLFEQTFKNQ